MTSRGGFLRALARSALPATTGSAASSGIAFLIVALLAGCTPVNPGGAGGGGGCAGTQTTDGSDGESLAGCLLDEKDRPAIGAMVQVFPSTLSASAKVSADQADTAAGGQVKDTLVVYSDKTGRFSVPNTINPGVYDILFQTKDSNSQQGDSTASLALLKTNIHLETGVFIGLKPLKLLPRGFVQGLLVDKDDYPLWGAICKDQALRIVGVTDSLGWFSLALPQGIYNLTCTFLDKKDAVISGVKINSLQNTHLGRVTMFDVGPVVNVEPLPMKVIYDTVTGVAHISWPKTTYNGALFLYELKRTDINQYPADTFYKTTDTTFDDLIYRRRANRDSTKLYYSVSLKKVSSTSSTSDHAKIGPIDVKPPRIVGPDIGLAYAGMNIDSLPADSVPVPRDTSFTVGDTVDFSAKFENHFRSNTKLTWVANRAYDGEYTWIPDTTVVRQVRQLSGSDSFRYHCLVEGKLEVILTVEDELGTSNTVTARFEILKPKDP